MNSLQEKKTFSIAFNKRYINIQHARVRKSLAFSFELLTALDLTCVGLSVCLEYKAILEESVVLSYCF